jgi:hypothetical protein
VKTEAIGMIIKEYLIMLGKVCVRRGQAVPCCLPILVEFLLF